MKLNKIGNTTSITTTTTIITTTTTTTTTNNNNNDKNNDNDNNQIDYPILVIRPNLLLFQKKKTNCLLVNLTVLAEFRVKIKESEKININSERSEQAVKMKDNIVGGIGTIPKYMGMRLKEQENQRTNGIHTDYSIVKI